MRLFPAQNRKNGCRKLKRFLQDNQLVVRSTDKNLGLCVMTKDWYVREINRQLSDTDVYQPVQKSVEVLKQEVRNGLVETLTKMKVIYFSVEHNFIMHKRLQREVPNFYIIPKIHKSPVVGRPIVASTNWLTTNLSIWVTEHLKEYMNLCPLVLKDSTTLIRQLADIQDNLQPCTFVTLDVVSLYTNMDISQVITILANFLPNGTKLIVAIEFILRNNYFEFMGQIYHQTNGMAMGTNMAVLVANLFVAAMLDNKIVELRSFRDNILFYRRYIDDIFMLWNGSPTELNRFMKVIHCLARPLQFTAHSSTESIAFLDIEFFWENNHLQSRVYQKPLNRYLYIPFTSNHPSSAKKGFIKGELIRYVRLCSKESDFVTMKDLLRFRLRQRGYPDKVLASIYSQVTYTDRTHYLALKAPTESTDEPLILAVPYSPRILKLNLSEAIHTHEEELKENFPGFFGSARFLVAYKTQPSLGKMIISAKTSMPERELATKAWTNAENNTNPNGN